MLLKKQIFICVRFLGHLYGTLFVGAMELVELLGFLTILVCRLDFVTAFDVVRVTVCVQSALS